MSTLIQGAYMARGSLPRLYLSRILPMAKRAITDKNAMVYTDDSVLMSPFAAITAGQKAEGKYKFKGM